jgi:microcystin-dependent protein
MSPALFCPHDRLSHSSTPHHWHTLYSQWDTGGTTAGRPTCLCAAATAVSALICNSQLIAALCDGSAYSAYAAAISTNSDQHLNCACC